MLEKPHISDSAILERVRIDYGISADALDFLPLGNDSSAWVYRLTAHDGRRYFLKLRANTVYESSLIIPKLLQAHGIKQVVPPLLNLADGLWTPFGDYALILYPYIDGQNGGQAGLTPDQRRELGAVVAAIHAFPVKGTPLEQMRREDFEPKYAAKFARLKQAIEDGSDTGMHAVELRAFWRTKRADIENIVRRVDDLGRALKQSSQPLVLCHADIHHWNVLIDRAGLLWVIDWDEALLAPKERDLMFAGKPDENPHFYNGYGSADYDPVVWSFYLYEWAMQEIADFGLRVFLPEFGDDTKRDALKWFRHQFDAGQIVDAAYKSEASLPRPLQAPR